MRSFCGQSGSIYTVEQRVDFGRPGSTVSEGSVIFIADCPHNCKKFLLKKLIKDSREVEALSRLDHESIVPLEDLIQGEEQFAVFPYIEEAGSLAYVKGEVLDETAVVDIAYQIALALRHMSEQGVVHCDLKPGNVLFSKPVKLIDFQGAALLNDPKKNRPCAITPHYVAPEIPGKGKLTEKADIYSLGIMVYGLATGLDVPEQKLDVLRRAVSNYGTYPLFTLVNAQRPEDLYKSCGMLHPNTIKRNMARNSKFLRDFVLTATDLNPVDRPTAAATVKEFERYV